MGRLILKTWKKGEDEQHQIFTDMREALDKTQEDEHFYVIREIENIEQLRKLKEKSA